MAIFGRKKSTDPEVPEDLQQYYNNAGGSSVLKWILRIIALLIFLALLIWGGLWLFHKLTAHKSTSTAGKATSSQQAKTPGAKAPATKAPSAQSGGSNTGTSSNGSSTATGNSSTPPATSSTPSNNDSTSTNTPKTTPSTQDAQGTGTNGQALVNTGPGTVAMVWLFGVATLIGTMLHMLVGRRRAA